MERLDASQARDHLELVERILAESQQRLCSGGEFFVVWGIFSAAVTIVLHLVGAGTLPEPVVWTLPALLAACVVFSVVRGRQLRRALGRQSIVQREFFNVLWLTLGLAFVANVGIYRIFSGMASAAIWSFAEAIVLLYIGMHGNRRAQVAGVLVVVSMIVANFTSPPNVAYVLAAGMVVGYAGFGLAELLARD